MLAKFLFRGVNWVLGNNNSAAFSDSPEVLSCSATREGTRFYHLINNNNNNNHVLFHLWWKGNLLNHRKVSNIMNMIVATTCFKQYSIYSKSAGSFSDFLSAVIRMPFFGNNNICLNRNFLFHWFMRQWLNSVKIPHWKRGNLLKFNMLNYDFLVKLYKYLKSLMVVFFTLSIF